MTVLETIAANGEKGVPVYIFKMKVKDKKYDITKYHKGSPCM